jgi:predicted Fe-Mo cluster-binding NifX family protein
MKRVLLLGILFVFAISMSLGHAAAADKIKIAVASDGNTPASAVSPVAGRSSYFLTFDGKGVFIEALGNPHKNAGGGAGYLVVDFLGAKGTTTIIAGAFGDKMISAMKAKGINYIEFKGTAADAVKKAVKK